MELSLTIPKRFQAKQKTNIIDAIEKNYKISRRVYQSLFVNVADIFLNIFIR